MGIRERAAKIGRALVGALHHPEPHGREFLPDPTLPETAPSPESIRPRKCRYLHRRAHSGKARRQKAENRKHNAMQKRSRRVNWGSLAGNAR